MKLLYLCINKNEKIMKNQAIYTPTTKNTLTESYSKHDIVQVTTPELGTVTGVVWGFPTHGVNDTDYRMQIVPANNWEWVGQIVVSLESNYYGNTHISECKIEKI